MGKWFFFMKLHHTCSRNKLCETVKILSVARPKGDVSTFKSVLATQWLGQSEVSSGENEAFTRFSSAKVRILRLKVWSLRLLAR
jgi:hypothetical protein